MKRQGTLITLILIAIVAAVGIFTVNRMKKTTVAPSTAIVTPIPNVQVVGTSDADLDKDIQGVDTKLKALNTDAASIDEGLNDQQGNLSEQ